MSRHSSEDQPTAGPQTTPISDRNHTPAGRKPHMSETNLSSAGNILCDFCYRKAVTQLHRYRNTTIRKLFNKPPKTANVCALHIPKGLDYIRGLK